MEMSTSKCLQTDLESQLPFNAQWLDIPCSMSSGLRKKKLRWCTCRHYHLIYIVCKPHWKLVELYWNKCGRAQPNFDDRFVGGCEEYAWETVLIKSFDKSLKACQGSVKKWSKIEEGPKQRTPTEVDPQWDMRQGRRCGVDEHKWHTRFHHNIHVILAGS